MSTFSGIEVMKQALLAQRTVMDVIGNNVSNANTPGYARQVVDLTESDPYPFPGTLNLYGAGQIGTGVTVKSIEGIRDNFIDSQLNVGTTDQGENDVEVNTLSQVENAFNEPSTDEGISNAMSSFFTAWQTLSETPGDTTARNQVVSTANSLIDSVHTTDQSLRNIRVGLNSQLQTDVGQINSILHQIATLNPEIAKVYTQGMTPNDLIDQREELLSQLSKYVNINTSNGSAKGMENVAIGGRVLIDDSRVYDLNYSTAWDHPSQQTKTPYFNDVSQDDFKMLAQYSSGELKGIIDSRDNIVTNAQNQLTDVITTLMNTVNNAHSQGMGTDLQDMSVVGGTTTTAAISSMNNYASIAPQNTQYFNVGDNLQIKDVNTGDSVTVKVTDIDTTNGRLYFNNIGPLVKSQETSPNVYTTTSFTIGAGAEIRRIADPKQNFFDLQNVLGDNLVGDTNPDFSSQMTSTIALPDSVTAQTTLQQLGDILGVNIGNVNGQRLQLDNQAYTIPITNNMTLDSVFSQINQQNLNVDDGKGLNIKFDTVNRTVTITGDTKDALSQLGGANGSDCNLLRVLGLEGNGIAGTPTADGTQLTSTLSSLGIGSGYIKIDNNVIEVNSTDTLQSTLNNINTALNVDPSQTSYGTNVFFDGTRIRVVSPHQFSVDTPGANEFPAAADTTTGSTSSSNFLTVLGLQSDASQSTYSNVQGLASVTSSDISARISLNASLTNDVNQIATATSYSGIPGDNTAALSIAGIQNNYLMASTTTGNVSQPTQTINSAYNSMISDIGSQASQANLQQSTIKNFVEYYTNQQSSVSGVSIDEEMTKMIESQYAYQAASRMVSTLDTMLNTIINSTGAGR